MDITYSQYIYEQNNNRPSFILSLHPKQTKNDESIAHQRNYKKKNAKSVQTLVLSHSIVHFVFMG